MNSSRLWWLIALTIVIHLVDTLSYSVRLNSVKSKNFAMSTSLFNIIVLLSRTANTIQAPLIGGLVDYSLTFHYDPILEFRKVIVASTTGTLLGILLIPTFLRVFSMAVGKLKEKGSIPSLIIYSLNIVTAKRVAENTVRPSKSMLRGLRFRDIPKRLLLINTLITGIYTIGVLAAYYASIYSPNNSVAIISSSGVINGAATLLLTLFVDPKAAQITDEVSRGEREYLDVKALVIMLIGTKLLGTLLAQLLLLPSARLIAYIVTGT